jgi:pimeloyl-ACP methyl ester carboxylesterase
MVLVESSHEGQRPVLDPLRLVKTRLQIAFMIPSIIREPREERRGADPRSVIREWRAFRRATAREPFLPPGALGDQPLVVLTCAPGDPTVPDRVYEAWRGLHRDLARLSANSRHVISENPSHYLNEHDPDLVISAIRDVVRCARSGGRVTDEAGSDGQ